MRRSVISNLAFGLLVGLVFFIVGGFDFDGLPVGEIVLAFPSLGRMKPIVWIVTFSLVLPTLFTVLDQLVRCLRKQQRQG